MRDGGKRQSGEESRTARHLSADSVSKIIYIFFFFSGKNAQLFRLERN